MWVFWVFVGVLALIPFALATGVLHMLAKAAGRPHRPVELTFNVLVSLLGLGTMAVLVGGALDRPGLWIVVVLLGALLLWGGYEMLCRRSVPSDG